MQLKHTSKARFKKELQEAEESMEDAFEDFDDTISIDPDTATIEASLLSHERSMYSHMTEEEQLAFIEAKSQEEKELVSIMLFKSYYNY